MRCEWPLYGGLLTNADAGSSDTNSGADTSANARAYCHTSTNSGADTGADTRTNTGAYGHTRTYTDTGGSVQDRLRF
jgi:hypothetical protein